MMDGTVYYPGGYFPGTRHTGIIIIRVFAKQQQHDAVNVSWYMAPRAPYRSVDHIHANIPEARDGNPTEDQVDRH